MLASDPSRFDSLYQKHLTALKLHGHADKTIEAYSRAIRRLAECLRRCPDDVTKDELESHFASLLETHSWSTIKLDRNGIRFFFDNVLEKKLPWLDLIKGPKTQRLPDILTHTEIARIIRGTRRFDFRCFWFVTYSLGLRLVEALNLEVGDIDAERMRVHVRYGKGTKDRFVIMPAMTLAVLRKLWCSHKHPRLLFPARPPTDGAPTPNVLPRANVQKGFKRAVTDVAIHKHVSIHSLRHSYATHMIEAGLNLRAVQEQLGHGCPKTTARYVRITEKSSGDAQALIDGLIGELSNVLRRTPDFHRER
jgi:integrase